MKTVHLLTTFMLVAALLLVIGPVRAASATTITVDTTVDDNTANGNCTLREAIIAANTDAAVDKCPAGSGSDTISLPSASYVLTVGGTNEDTAATGDLDTTDTAGSLTIIGAGAGTTTIDAAGLDRVFDVFANVTLNVSGVTITGGSVPGPGPSGLGGGIRNVGGTVTIADSILSASTAGNAGGIWNGDGTVTIANSMLSENTAQYNAGGIYNNGGTVILTDSTVAVNTAGSLGGGICQYWGTVTISNSTITGNSALGGGGVYNVNPGTVVTIDNSTITGNTAVGQGGGISNGNDGTVTVTNATITGNTANTDGGGIFNDEYGTAELTNTIVAAQPLGGDCSGVPVTSLGHNLDSDDTCSLVAAGDIPNANPLLGPLQDNGGPTETHALLPDSPAIDAGDSSACPDTDQRGEPRPVDGDGDGSAVCDIGAYEYQPGDEEVVILPSIGGQTYTIYPGQVGVIVQGWAAATPGLVRAWEKASNYDLTLYKGETEVFRLTQEQVDQLWGPIEPRPDLVEQCMMRPTTSSAVWRYVVTGLAPGTYQLHSRTWIDHPLTDGCDSIDGDGKPDMFYPDTYVLETVNTIIITGD